MYKYIQNRFEYHVLIMQVTIVTLVYLTFCIIIKSPYAFYSLNIYIYIYMRIKSTLYNHTVG